LVDNPDGTKAHSHSSNKVCSSFICITPRPSCLTCYTLGKPRTRRDF
jgi:hypothetical protein